MKLRNLLLLSLLPMISCQNKNINKYEKLNAMKWLVGNWEQKVTEGILTENWKIENDSTFSGESYFIKSEDTIHKEYIKLAQIKNELIYSATVIGQNDDKAADFKLNSESQTDFVFENPKHDYPQKISYKKSNTNTLMVTISGKQQGKISSERYVMKKVNQ